MNRILGFTFFLLFLAGFAFVSFDGMQRRAALKKNQEPMPLTDTDWLLTDTGPTAIDHEIGVYVRLGADGELNGHAGCNNFFGPYEISGTEIEIGPLAATRKMCTGPQMDIEKTFMNGLRDARGFEIEGNKLALTDYRGRVMTLTGQLPAEETE